MKNKLIGFIAVIWGGAIVVKGLLSPETGSGAYGVGSLIGFGFGAVLLLVGGRQLWREFSGRNSG